MTRQTAALRHDLRTPVNHIVGYAEMLLEDLPAGARPARDALEVTLHAAREVLHHISSALPGTQDTVEDAAVQRLYEELREPQRRIVDAMTALLRATGATDATFLADIQRILRAAEQLDGAEATPAATPPATSPGPTTAPHVLVVDDIEDNREVLRRRLERQGCRVTCAVNGRDAVDKVRAGAFDLVLLDVLMPEMDGYTVLETLKADAATRDLPVIMISALDDMASIVRCIERGAEDYLPKPFDPVLLKARITASLEKKRLRDHEKEYLQRVNRLTDAAGAVEAGTYQSGALADVADEDDALGRLARIFDGLADRLREREQRLHEQVRALRREIQSARESGMFRPPPEALDGHGRFAGRYEIMAPLGRGGMGVVYRAHDHELGEDVAIKTLRAELTEDPTVVERFKSEIRLARRISHRNIVRTHDLGESGGILYLTMEFVEGITLRDLIDVRGRLAVGPVLGIAAQLADALAAAHEVGVIHRDVKPQNLLLDGDGVLKVMDFGVSRLTERTSPLTEAGLIIGTPAYMAPEQILGEDVDPRADLWAAGVVLYEALTGEVPFDAATPVSLVAKVLNDEPAPVLTRNRDVPAAVSALVMRLLSKRPDDRVRTAAELAQRLRELS